MKYLEFCMYFKTEWQPKLTSHRPKSALVTVTGTKTFHNSQEKKVWSFLWWGIEACFGTCLGATQMQKLLTAVRASSRTEGLCLLLWSSASLDGVAGPRVGSQWASEVKLSCRTSQVYQPWLKPMLTTPVSLVGVTNVSDPTQSLREFSWSTV